MSYILDALRKSEHERQIAAGQNISMLYPIEIQHNRKPWLILVWLVLAALIVFIVIWWMWSRPIAIEDANKLGKPAVNVALQLPAISEETLPEPKPEPKPINIPKLGKITPGYAQKKISISAVTVAEQKPPAQTESEKSANTTATINQPASANPLKELPALNITGYIHNEQSGSLAMINNQLVHEGEEVSPGLLLVKILDNSAIFSYKGYVFSR
jgi:general secretion pathway protein B